MTATSPQSEDFALTHPATATTESLMDPPSVPAPDVPTPNSKRHTFNPMTAKCSSPETPCHNPEGVLYDRGLLGLTYTSSDPCTGGACLKMLGNVVTACADMDFGASMSGTLLVRYLQTGKPLYGDSCEGATCGTHPGMSIFVRYADADWQRLHSESSARTDGQYQNVQLQPANPVRYVRICRGGGGPHRDNIGVKSVQFLTTRTRHTSPLSGEVRQLAENKIRARLDHHASAFINKSGVFAGTFNGIAGAGSKAYACQALAMGYREFGDRGYLTMAAYLADQLADAADENKNGVVGWSVNKDYANQSPRCPIGSHDAFSDGSCNPVGTEYTLQTGNTLTCLLEVYKETKKTSLLELAKKGIDQSFNYGTRISDWAGFHFYYSYHSNDSGRIVRNTSTIMAPSLALYYEITGDVRYRDLLYQTVRAEIAEYHSGNKGYLSRHDPAFVRNPSAHRLHIENHYPLMPSKIGHIESIMGWRLYSAYINGMMKDWLNCSTDLCKAGLKYSGDVSTKVDTYTFYVCSVAAYSSTLKTHCESQIRRAKTMNDYQAIQVLLDFRS